MFTKSASWFGAITFLVLVGACGSANDDEITGMSSASSAAPATTARTYATPRPTATAAAAAAAAEAPTPGTGEQITVARVIDGDTFELADGRTVRVLGIDSCEMSTPGGPLGKAAAQNLLDDGAVYLLTEPGVTTDRYGRLLRYVQVAKGDLGTELVGYDHTGVYDGDNDASASYVAALYAHDLKHAKNPPAGRDCGDPTPTPTPTAERQPQPEPQPERQTQPEPKQQRSASYKNCSEVRAAGAAPIRRGDPGWSSKFDRDGDGVGCE